MNINPKEDFPPYPDKWLILEESLDYRDEGDGTPYYSMQVMFATKNEFWIYIGNASYHVFEPSVEGEWSVDPEWGVQISHTQFASVAKWTRHLSPKEASAGSSPAGGTNLNCWEKGREDPKQAAFEGWRQHWLQMWGFIGQQYLIDYRYKVCSP